MSSFETVRPAPQEQKEVSISPIQERRSALERVMNALPQWKPVMLAFVTSTALMSAPEFAHAEKQEAVIEGTEQGPSGHELLPNIVYEHRVSTESADGDEKLTENSDGAIPEHAEHVVLGVERSTASTLDTKNDEAHSTEHFNNRFYVAPAAHEHLVAGQAFEMKGVGATSQEALQNALEEATLFMGLDIASDRSLTEEQRGQDASSGFAEHITSSAKHAISGYRVTERQDDSLDGIQGARGYCSVTVEIVPAVATAG